MQSFPQASMRDPKTGVGEEMTGLELRCARRKLGEMWGFGRPLHFSELARALRLGGRDPGQTIVRWESGNGPKGPASVAIEMMLAGAPAPDPISVIIRKKYSAAANTTQNHATTEMTSAPPTTAGAEEDAENRTAATARRK